MPYIEVSQLSKSFQTQRGPVPVLRDLEFAVETGEMVAIVGASGVGKSTLLHLLGGLDSADSGSIVVGGVDIAILSDAERVNFRHSQVGFVFQFHHLLPEFTALENAEMPLRVARMNPEQGRPRAKALLGRVGLGNRLDHRPGMLSGGEQQRVAIARALAMEPTLLLADEPTGDLDEATAKVLHDLLREMHRERRLTSIIATHNMRLAAGCDRVLHLEAGQLRLT
ncbi:MAG TPA: ABC transporter ATP-binding protein [Acidobacteria bacterium]|jgi:lipoprotein-releasing system ATP-binding protein|nr:ABC transporter ATP-binding protein [Acidobacteriota bacterium]HIN69636.1 ABC transporter ATP-binding protein [Acidobacteriota bacterium]